MALLSKLILPLPSPGASTRCRSSTTGLDVQPLPLGVPNPDCQDSPWTTCPQGTDPVFGNPGDALNQVANALALARQLMRQPLDFAHYCGPLGACAQVSI